MEQKKSKETKSFSWPLRSGRLFQVKDQGLEREDWYNVEVAPGYEILIGQGKIKQGGKVGEGRITDIKGEGRSFFSGDILVCPGKEARVFFEGKKGKGKKVS